MENYSDSDTSSESEFDSSKGSIAESDDESQDLEPEPSKYRHVLWNLDAQTQAQLDSVQLAQLHAEIEARTKMSVNPTYPKLAWSRLFQLFDVRILFECVVHLIHYFEFFRGPDVWNIFTENSNAYA
jgi:hypothetical protein